MIKNSEPISMIEALEITKKLEKANTEVVGFVKKFVKGDAKKIKILKEKIQELNLMKVRDFNIAKIIDLMPENSGELNKIFVDVTLSEDESKKILDTIKEFK